MTSNDYPPLKKPKIEAATDVMESPPPPPPPVVEGVPTAEQNGSAAAAALDEEMRMEQQEALIALVEHRSKEVDHLRQRISYYKSQLVEAEKRLEDTQSKLARLRGKNISMASKTIGDGSPQIKSESSPSRRNHDSVNSAGKDLKVSRRTPSPSRKTGFSQNQTQSKPQLVIPSVSRNIAESRKMKETRNEPTSGSSSLLTETTPPKVNATAKPKGNSDRKISVKKEALETQPKEPKRKLEQKEHKDLVTLIKKSSSPHTIHCHSATLLPSQHKRKLRSLILCPTNDQLFATSALDGIVNLWQIQGRGVSASRVSSHDCSSEKARRWAEDIAWHPEGNKLFAVYHADSGDSQISILDTSSKKVEKRVNYLADKPHTKGIINSIMFLPWEDTCFVTGGSDHAVILWTDKDGEGSWKPKPLHRSNHSSAVMGVAGMRNRKVVMSVGADKRIIGYDVETGRADYKHMIESKCMSVLPNPCDFNLFMVQTGAPEKQLRLFDLRVRQLEVHSMGWTQESSESQSALINQAWSPDGLYLTSGSADPQFHIFDIRYNSRKPSQTVKAHDKRVFKAAWHHNLPLLVSISSDLNIGLHKI